MEPNTNIKEMFTQKWLEEVDCTIKLYHSKKINKLSRSVIREVLNYQRPTKHDLFLRVTKINIQNDS